MKSRSKSKSKSKEGTLSPPGTRREKKITNCKAGAKTQTTGSTRFPGFEMQMQLSEGSTEIGLKGPRLSYPLGRRRSSVDLDIHTLDACNAAVQGGRTAARQASRVVSWK